MSDFKLLKMKVIIHKAAAWTQEELIRVLKPDYHVMGQTQTFKKRTKIDSTAILAYRKHQRVFMSESTTLVMYADTKIHRHSMVKLDANPYLDRGYTSSPERIGYESKHPGFKHDSHSLHIAARNSGCEVLERSAVKVARFVLRRGRRSNHASLFDDPTTKYINMTTMNI